LGTRASIGRLVAALLLAGAFASIAYADPSSIKPATPPKPGQEPTSQGSSIHEVPGVHKGQEPVTPSGFAGRFVTMPVKDRAVAQRPQTDEPIPEEETNPSLPPPRPPDESSDNRPHKNEAILPSSIVQRVILPAGTGRQSDFGQPFSLVVFSDPNIAADVPINNHSILINALTLGNTDIFVYDVDDNLISRLNVIVDDFAFRKEQPLPDDLTRRYSFVDTSTGRNLREPYRFRCGPGGCFYAGDSNAYQPALLPGGHVDPDIPRVNETKSTKPGG
jgi:hypothetical protein